MMEPVRRAAEDCLRLDPQNHAARYLLGAAYLNSGQEAEARREWEQLFAIAPAYPKLRTELGRLLVGQGERKRGLALIAEGRRAQLDEAEFNRLVIRVGTDSENVDLRRKLARWCMKHGRLSRAILEWEEVLARVTEDAEARRGLQTARSLRGDQ
jgi:cytochrome c-type biogenesis protein CcmH/NrfG